MGLTAVTTYPDAKAEEVFGTICRDVVVSSDIGYCAVVVVIAAVIAAVMSTTDSALLSISSTVTKDVVLAHLYPELPEGESLRLSKIISWVVLFCLVFLSQIEITLYRLMTVKTELLAQLFPAFVLGVNFPQVSGPSVLVGLVVGLVVITAFTIAEVRTITGIHGGIWALILNLVSLCVCHYCLGPPEMPTTDAEVDARRDQAKADDIKCHVDTLPGDEPPQGMVGEGVTLLMT